MRSAGQSRAREPNADTTNLSWEEKLNDNREFMIREHLLKRGITDPEVISAMREVRRELFIPERMVMQAYEDFPLPIDEGQTISQPYIVAGFIIYTPAGNAIFGCAPIGADVWLFLIPFALLLLTADEIRKYVVRSADPNNAK